MNTQKKKQVSRDNDWMPPLSAFEQTGYKMIEGDHPAMLSDEALLKDVALDFGRTGGPGGQHRNRKATSCTATHVPSDYSGKATERRRQSENRKLAFSRLRRTLAIHLRRTVTLDGYVPSELWKERRQGDKFPINPKHSDYPHVLAEALDIIFASEFNQSTAAEALLISSSQLLKIVSHEKAALTWLNDQRKERGLSPLSP